jgi:outer membrane protein TolC
LAVPAVVLFAAGVVAPSAGAQERAVRLSLAEAVARATAASHRLAELDARREASDAAVAGARAAGLPLVVLQGGYTRTNHVDEFGVPLASGDLRVIYPDVPDNWHSRLALQWPVYTGGRIEALLRASRADAEAAQSDLGAAQADLRLEVARAYWAFVTAREAVRVVEESLRRVEAHLADARARLDAGLVAPSDVSSADARRALQEALLLETRNTEEVNRLALGRLLGVGPATDLAATEPLDRAEVGGAAPATSDDARRLRDDRRALASRVAAAVERRVAAEAGRRPTVSTLAGLDYARPNPRIFPRAPEWQEAWDAGVTAAWTLFDGGRVRAEVSGAAATERALQRRLDEFDSLLDLEVRQRQLEVESSRARAAAAAAAVLSAAESHRVLQDRYAAGVASSTDVLDAQVLWLEAQLSRTRALAALRLAEAGLDRAVGR